MASKTIYFDDIGDVTFTKRRDAKNIKVRIVGSHVRVSLPTWVPYSSAISYIKQRTEWINQNRRQAVILRNGTVFGKDLRLLVKLTESSRISSKFIAGILTVNVPIDKDISSDDVQKKIKERVIKILQMQAEQLLVPRVRQLAKTGEYDVNRIEVRRLRSRWGSCTSEKNMTFNLFLIQLPWQFIDYVIYHELSHTVHMNHGSQFWALVESHVPNYKLIRKLMANYSPDIILQT
ncbi:MAG: M48 family metallopeptidase [Candidatus Nomurabacteria bacterium]|nr:M48 family metallopeptidase [Candidatus Saccharibacteria bacterium]USN95500.1 MAG: M48 family metallopeptidase [Candidatus Nomurabacteria bacterium]